MSESSRLKSAIDWLSSGLLVVAAALVIYRLATNYSDDAVVASSPAEKASGWLEPSSTRYQEGTGDVAIVEFSDFECDFCRYYAQDVLPDVRRSLVASGKVRYAMLNFPLERVHPLAFKMAEVAECAGRQGRFWLMHDRLFTGSIMSLSDQEVFAHEKSVGLNSESFRECLRGEAAKAVQSDIAQGKRLGVLGTPTFFIGVVRDDGSVDIRLRVRGTTSLKVLEAAVAESRESS